MAIIVIAGIYREPGYYGRFLAGTCECNQRNERREEGDAIIKYSGRVSLFSAVTAGIQETINSTDQQSRTKYQGKITTLAPDNNINEGVQYHSQHDKIHRNESKHATNETEYLVPNIVHYIWFNDSNVFFRFHEMVSVLSAVKYIKPETIYIHADNPPYGRYWERVRQLPAVRVVKRELPTTVHGVKVEVPLFHTSLSNVAKIQVKMGYMSRNSCLDENCWVFFSVDLLFKQ